MKTAKRFVLFALFGIVVLRGCDCPPPIAISVNPASGPGGTIVEVTFNQGGLGGSVVWDGGDISTRNANSLGLSNTLRFTIPVGSSNGIHKVKVRSASKESNEVDFTVTGPGSTPTAQVQGFDVAEGIKELTLYGSNFTTNSLIIVDSDTVTNYTAVSAPFRVIPLDFVDNVIVCTLNSALVAGSSHTARVVNAPGVVSATFTFTVPVRKTTMEYTSIAGVPIPNYYVNRNGNVYSVRRSYTEAGMMLDLVIRDTSLTKPSVGGSGGGFTDADLFSWWRAHADTANSGWYLLAFFADTADDGLGSVTWGSMFMNSSNIPGLAAGRERRGFVVFRRAFTSTWFGTQIEQAYNRDLLHESGHAFNLFHQDTVGSFGRSAMARTVDLNASQWTLQFSTMSVAHVGNHQAVDVEPGRNAFGTRTCHLPHNP